MPLVTSQNGTDRIYLIDTTTRTISMYEAAPNAGLKLVAGRSFEVDSYYINAMHCHFLPYKPQGYDEALNKYVQELEKKVYKP